MTEYIYEHKPSGADHMGKPVELPTLVQREEIVRCCDCKEYRESDETCHSWQWHNWDAAIEVEPDGFCAWGVREEGRT